MRMVRGLCAALSSVALSFGLGCTVLVGSASAGTEAVVSCRLPSGGPAPTEGWTSGWTQAPLPFAGSGNTCSSNGGSLSNYVGAQTTQPGSSGPFWEYTPPNGFTLTGGQITASFHVPGSNTSPYTGATGLLGPQFQFDAADVVGGLPGGQTGLVESTYSLTGHTGGHLWLYAFCEPPGSPCPANYSREWFWASDAMQQATLVLSNNAQPSGSGFSGGVTGAGALAGSQNLLFQASDGGSGVYQVKAALSGQTVYSATPNTNSGECVPVGSYGSTPEFVSAIPCHASESVTIPIDTTAVHDGNHELTVAVIDAVGNETTVYAHTVETHNAPAVTAIPNITGVAAVGSTLAGTNGSFSVPSGAGSLSSITGQWLRCTDAAASHCSPIAQASGMTYQPQAADADYYLVYANTASDNDGTTTSDSGPTTAVTAPSLQSSCVGGECLHGGSGGVGGAGGAGSSGNGGAGSGVTINLPGSGPGNATLLGSPTKWIVTLKMSPKRVHKGTKIKLAGVVKTSPRPTAGKLIYVRARSVRRRGRHRVYGNWKTFVDLYTKADGSWHTSYKFQLGGRHVYQMQAVAPSEGGFQNPTGSSPAITVTER